MMTILLQQDDDPEENASEVTELQQLMSALSKGGTAVQLQNSMQQMMTHQLGDFFAQFAPTSSKQHCQGDIRVSTSGDEEEEEESTIIEPRLKSFSESLTSLKELLDYKGFTDKVTQVTSLLSTVASLCHSEACKRSAQTTLDHFIHS